MPPTPPPHAPLPDDPLIVRVQLSATRERTEVEVTITEQRPPARGRRARIAGDLLAMAGSAIVAVLVDHITAPLTTLL